MVLPIVAYGDPVLRQVADPIPKGLDLKELINDMFETMHEASGIGLAAPQIGKSIRLFVVDTTGLDPDPEEPELTTFKKVFINATILSEQGEEWAMEEGCLSIPGIRENVSRPETLTIHYFDENWQEHEHTYSGMIARVIQHEYDHIEGILFTDYLSPLKKRMLKNRLSGISRGQTNATYRMKFPLATKAR